MICYIDEKMYGPPPEGVSDEQLLQEIQELEIRIYGRIITRSLDEPVPNSTQGKTIYSVEEHKEIEVEQETAQRINKL